MKGKITLAAATLAAAAALVAVPLTSASSVDTKLQIGYSLRLFDGQLGVQLADGHNVSGETLTNFYGGPNVADGIFHHVAVTVKRNSTTGGKLFVDGVVVLTFDPTSRPNSLTNTAELRIACEDGMPVRIAVLDDDVAPATSDIENIDGGLFILLDLDHDSVIDCLNRRAGRVVR